MSIKSLIYLNGSDLYDLIKPSSLYLSISVLMSSFNLYFHLFFYNRRGTIVIALLSSNVFLSRLLVDH